MQVWRGSAAPVSDAGLSCTASQHRGSVGRTGQGEILFQENKVGWEKSTNSFQGVTLKVGKAAQGHREKVEI